MIVPPVDHRDMNRRIAERLGAGQAAEAGAHDHHAGTGFGQWHILIRRGYQFSDTIFHRHDPIAARRRLTPRRLNIL